MGEKRRTSKAPAPIKPVGERPMLRLPVALPEDYPNLLKTQTEAVLVRVAEAGFLRRELVLCCKVLLSGLDPNVHAAVYLGLRPDIAMEAVREFIRQIIASNRESDEDRNEAARQVRESEAWRKLVQGIEEAWNRRVREGQAVAVQTPIGTPAPVINDSEQEQEFTHSPDYRTVTLHGVSFDVKTEEQAAIVRCLAEARTKGLAGLTRKTLLSEAGLPDSSRVRNFFQRGAQRLYKTLIEFDQPSKLYRLQLPPIKSRRN